MINNDIHTLLLIEDDPIIALSETIFLEKEGFKVIHAYSGENAIDYLKSNSNGVHLILMDIDLGSENMIGTEAAKIIVNEFNIPLVFLSSHVEKDVVEKTEDITSYGYIVKNSGNTVLLTSIKMALKLYYSNKKLKESEERLQITIQSIGDGFITTDLNGNITIMNPIAEKLCGWDFKDAYQMPLDSIFQIENAFTRERVFNPVKKVLESGKIVGLANHTILISKDKKEYQIADTAAPIFDYQKNISGAVLVFSDVTEKYQKEEALFINEKKYQNLFNSALDAILITDNEGYIIDANPAAAQLFGFAQSEFIGRHSLDITPIVKLEDWKLMWKQFQEKGTASGEYEAVSKDGKKIYLEFQAVAHFLTGMHLSIIRDVSIKKKQEEQLFYQANVFDSVSDAIVCTDLDFKITSWNKGAEFIYGYTKEEVIGKPSSEILKSNFQNATREEVKSFLLTEGQWTGEVIQKRKDNSEILIQGFVSKLYNPENICIGIVSINRDLTKIKNIEEKLKLQEFTILENKNRLVGIIESAMDGIISIDKNHKIILINPAAIKIFGYESNDILGHSINKLIPERFHSIHLKHIIEFEKTGVTTRTMNALSIVSGRRSNGNEFPMEASISQIEIGNEKIFTIILRDITDKKISEEKIIESEKKLREAQRISKLGSWHWNKETGIIELSDELYNLFNLKKESFQGTFPEILKVFHPEDRNRVRFLMIKAVNGYKPRPIEVRILSPNNQIRFILGEGELKFNNDKLVYIAGTIQDITERKISENKIKELLLEKELLLKEVHHRIKNNMQAIAGLLSIHASSIENEEASSILMEAMSRINGMGILYDKLYRTADFKVVSVKAYLSDLAKKILELASNSKSIQLKEEIEDFNLNTRILFPVGIIVNEVITNSIKYAFREDNKNILRLQSVKNEKNVRIIIEDNGSGFKDKKDFTNGFGLKLIQLLTAQLHGKHFFENKNGTMFTLEFPIN
ncbi:MAG: PAS domain S-box protein [Leptospiraceae bacterium]|nr:PAS domain S-box protein [Leptospiraceae bacterium]